MGWSREGSEVVVRTPHGEVAAGAGAALPVAVANAAQEAHTPERTHSWGASRPDRDREVGDAGFEAAVGGRRESDGRVVADENVAGGEGCLENPVPFVTLEREAVVVVAVAAAVGECPRHHKWTRSRRNP